ncbi:AMP-binding protein [Streptomyces globisporus]|uniref:AMP-binding protein n=1 Tax=Streptomyces globisporus TaxID=1908 RepID=A0A927GQ34_STRGL|nr:AMP-binding protein [Streptomyces globisporus]
MVDGSPGPAGRTGAGRPSHGRRHRVRPGRRDEATGPERGGRGLSGRGQRDPGYHGRAALTAQRFLPDPYGPPGSRLYRTGDLGRVEGSGELRLLGRIDHQVKLHGRRIEPGEIEAAMTAHPHVSLAAAVPAGAGAGATLTGFFTGAEADAEELRGFLAQRLPAALVPSRLVALDTLPLSPTARSTGTHWPTSPRGRTSPRYRRHPNTPTPSYAPSSTPQRTSWAEHLSPRTRTSSTRAATPCTRPGSWPSCARPWTRRSASARSSSTRHRPSWPTHCASRSTTPRTVVRAAARKASCPPPSTVCGCWRRSPRPPPSTPSLSPSISRAPWTPRRSAGPSTRWCGGTTPCDRASPTGTAPPCGPRCRPRRCG